MAAGHEPDQHRADLETAASVATAVQVRLFLVLRFGPVRLDTFQRGRADDLVIDDGSGVHVEQVGIPFHRYAVDLADIHPRLRKEPHRDPDLRASILMPVEELLEVLVHGPADERQPCLLLAAGVAGERVRQTPLARVADFGGADLSL